jgi:hypothetical protein
VADTPNNLTTLAVTDADLMTRFPRLGRRYLAAGVDTFAAQRDAAKAEALADFRAFTGKDPARCVPADPASWQRVLTLHTLILVMRGSTDEDSRVLAEGWDRERRQVLQDLLFSFDADGSGALEDLVSEAPQRVGEVRLWR